VGVGVWDCEGGWWRDKRGLERERVALAEAERLFGYAGAGRAIAVAEAVAERVRSSSSGREFASGIIFGLTKTASPASRAGQQARATKARATQRGLFRTGKVFHTQQYVVSVLRTSTSTEHVPAASSSASFALPALGGPTETKHRESLPKGKGRAIEWYYIVRTHRIVSRTT
jgi:hypothetical protein